jgi:cell division protein FtsW (lipid II flippase)
MVATSILFSRSFEIFLIAALAVITVLLFTGNGSFMLKSKNSTKTRTPEEEKKMGRQLSYVTGIWLLAEFLLLFFGNSAIASIIYIVVIVISMIILVKFFKNNG